MGMVSNMCADVQRGACLEPGGVHDCAVQYKATPANKPPQFTDPRNSQAGRQAGRHTAVTAS